MDTQRAAEIQVVLEGVSLPASREELVRYASGEDAAAGRALEQIPDRQYDRIDAVGEALVSTDARQVHPVAPPGPESGEPPGGDDYLNPAPVSGAVRRASEPRTPPEQVLEQQAKAQKRQQASNG